MGDQSPAGGAAFLAGLAAGSRVAGYRLEGQIGQGGMAVVFRALDEPLQRQVALKILMPALSADASFRQRFIRESRIAAAIDDPHIIPVFAAGEADGVLYIAMRYVPGGDALTLLRRTGPLSPARAAGLVSAVASALDAAHAAGLVHRDVKPANMLMDAQPGRPDHVYLSDFGLSKAALSSVGLTAAGQFLGTLDYSAPEQIEGRPVDGRTDQYALACAAFELLSGAPPFTRDQGMAVLYAQLSAPPPPLSAHRPGLAPAADPVLTRALAKAPADRYPNCREFADALREAFGLPAYDPARGAPLDHPPTEIAYLSGPGEQWRAMPAAAGPAQQAADGQRTVTGVARQIPAPRPEAVPGGPAAASEPTGRPSRRGLVLAALAATLLAAGGVTAAIIASTVSRHSAATAPEPAPAAVSHPSSPVTATARHSQHSPGSSADRSPGGGTTAQLPQAIRSFADPGSSGQHVDSVAFSPDGKLLASGDADGNTYLWDTATGQQVGALPAPASTKVFSVAFSPDGTVLATGDRNGSTYLWDSVTRALIATVRDPGGMAVNSVAFSPSGGLLATGDKNGRSYLWHVLDGGHATTLAGTLPDPAGAGIWALAFSPDGTKLATADFGGQTYLWNPQAPAAPPAGPYTIPGRQYATAVAFSPDGALLATGDVDGDTYLWDLANGTHTVIPEPSTVWGVAFSPSGTLAIADADGTTYLWDTTTNQQTGVLTDPQTGPQGVGAIAFSGDGKVLAAGDTNGSTYLWKAS